MSLQQPWLLILLIVPVLVLIRRWHGRREATIVVGDSRFFAALPVSLRQRLRRLPLLIRVLTIAVLIVTAARPQLEKVTQRITSEGIDIIIALDLSESMRALDFAPKDRLTVAKEVTSDFIEGRLGDRIGLVLFGTRAITQCPLTVDHGVVIQLVQKAQPGMLGPATAIGMAVATATNRLRDAPGKSRVVVLVTDGNNTAGKIDPITAARLAKALGVKIYTVAVGAKGQAIIPGPAGKRYIGDELDEDTLREVAREGNGKFYRATDADSLKRIFDEIDQLERTKVEREKSTHYGDRFEPLLWAGVALLMLELLLVGGPLRKVV
ncbi:MAG: VWA domain-containing protein [Candidatus Lernaella stagnicola]|nr:VWA domain-containing protein [Candidatus Lernaella stagnicola]